MKEELLFANVFIMFPVPNINA